MSLGLQLFIIAAAMWGLLAWQNDYAPVFLWRWLWVPVMVSGLLLLWLASFMTGKGRPEVYL